METERTEILVLLGIIKENIKNNPNLKCWQGIFRCNSKEISWRVKEKSLDFLREGNNETD